jgi:transposase
MHAIIHPADIQDRDGGLLVLKTLFGRYPFLKALFADGGYQGSVFADGQKKSQPNIETKIVKRSEKAKGFEVLPRRWVVERTFAWLGRCRRLAKDFENISSNALAFLRLASIRLMLRSYVNNGVITGRTLRPPCIQIASPDDDNYLNFCTITQ